MYLTRIQNKFIFLLLKTRQWIIGFMYPSIQPTTKIMSNTTHYIRNTKVKSQKTCVRKL